MSSHNRRLVVAPKAQKDMKDIAFYTRKTWGDTQMIVYAQKIEKVFEHIMGNPLIGQRSSLNPDKYRVYPFGSHMMIYRVKPEAIHIVRVLHQRMHSGQQLSDI